MQPRPDVERGVAGFVRWLLRVPLFYKILLANAVIVLAGIVGSTALTRAILRSGAGFPTGWIIVLALSSLALTILVNAVIVRLALSPLKLLEQTAARVQAGGLDARVPHSPLRDRELERLTRIFNSMLDNLDSYRSRLSALAARALDAEEQERMRIARELHDDTAQSLAALLIRLRLLRRTRDPDVRDREIDDFRKEVGEALERVRRYARGLRPPALDELGLVPALESHARGLSESVGVNIRVETEPIEQMLSQQAELALYRIAQEAISNAIRHARAESVVVRIRPQADRVFLSVTDDGRGFRLDQVRDDEERGLGLFGMRERAGYFGGQVAIHSVPGRGTEVVAVIPSVPPHPPLRPEGAGQHAVDR